MSKRLAGKAEEEEEKVEVKEDVGGQMEAATSSVCDPTLKEVQTTSPPSSQFCSACTYHSPLIHIVFMSRSPSCLKGASSGITDFTCPLSRGSNHTQICTN